GGNIGTSAIAFARCAGPEGRVYSFEPLTHSLIRRNMEANGIHNVTVVPAGVADRSGEAEMSYGDFFISASVARKPAHAKHAVRVPLMTVDGFVEDQGLDRVDFIKMD